MDGNNNGALATLDPEKVRFSEIGFSSGGVNLAPESLGQVVAFSQVMAKSAHAIPKHLRENPGACMAVVLDAMALRCNPYMLARKSYAVNDILAYEAAVFATAINTSPITVRRPNVTYSGEGQTRQCTVQLHLRDGDPDPVTSPKLADIKPQNSPLWKSDPDQQLAYYTIRAAVRRHCPEVLMGMMDREEAESAAPLDVVEPPASSGLAGRLAARQDVDPRGFNVRGVGDAIDGKAAPAAEEKPKRKAKASAPAPEPQAEGAGQAATEASADAPAGETISQDTSAASPGAEERPTTQADDTATGSAQSAEPEPVSSASATDAAGDSAAATSSPQPPAEQSGNPAPAADEATRAVGPGDLPGGEVIPGPAPADTAYILAGERFNDQRRLTIYKDGAPFSTISPLGLGKHPIYEQHTAKPAPATAHVAAPELVDVPDGYDEFFDSLSEAATWGECKMAVRALYAREDFKALGDYEQHCIRRAAWESIEGRGLPVDHAQEPAAFRLWIESRDGINGADDIEAVWRVLENEPAFVAMPEANKDSLRQIVAARLAELRAGG